MAPSKGIIDANKASESGNSSSPVPVTDTMNTSIAMKIIHDLCNSYTENLTLPVAIIDLHF